jgi:hypothetical protein
MNLAVIHLHRGAPPKPKLGDSCNGCGACCASEPCPIGAVASLRRRGRCEALEWDESASRYRCGLLLRAASSGRGAERLVARWIAAGQGCDAEFEATPAPA